MVVCASRYYGGWAAPQIYFLGFAGVIKFGNIRIGGLSGIYKSHHYNMGMLVLANTTWICIFTFVDVLVKANLWVLSNASCTGWLIHCT